MLIEQLGAEYHDYNLVIAGSRGQPVESNIIRKSMRQLIEANELPQVCFHSLRHPYVKPTTKKYENFFGECRRNTLQANGRPLLMPCWAWV